MIDTTIEIRKRVVEEYSELNHRLGKLKSFIGTVPFIALPVEQRALLEEQAKVMEQYRQILNRRLIIMGDCQT